MLFKKILAPVLVFVSLGIIGSFLYSQPVHALPPDCMKEGTHTYIKREATAADVERTREFPTPAKEGEVIVLIKSEFKACGGVTEEFFYLVKDKRWKESTVRLFTLGGVGSNRDSIIIDNINGGSTSSITSPWFYGENPTMYYPPTNKKGDFRIRVGGDLEGALKYLAESTNNDPAPGNPDIVDDQVNVGTGEKIKCKGSGVLGWILCPVVTTLIQTANDITGDYIVPLLKVRPLDSNNQLYDVWKSFRTLANIFFVLVFFVIIFSTAINNRE